MEIGEIVIAGIFAGLSGGCVWAIYLAQDATERVAILEKQVRRVRDDFAQHEYDHKPVTRDSYLGKGF